MRATLVSANAARTVRSATTGWPGELAARSVEDALLEQHLVGSPEHAHVPQFDCARRLVRFTGPYTQLSLDGGGVRRRKVVRESGSREPALGELWNPDIACCFGALMSTWLNQTGVCHAAWARGGD